MNMKSIHLLSFSFAIQFHSFYGFAVLKLRSTDWSALRQSKQDLLQNVDMNAMNVTATYRFMRSSLPVWIQHGLRDSGFLRALLDSSVLAVIPSVLEQHPESLCNFLVLSSRRAWADALSSILPEKWRPTIISSKVHFQRFQYGSHARQVIDYMKPCGRENQGLVLFVHGGAWGSGFPELYRLIAKPFIDRDMSVAILGYRTYPSSDVWGQVEDLQNAIAYIQKAIRPDDISLVGHSSGSHISILTLLTTEVPVDRFVALSGVYDIPSHYKFESRRGIERVSPLAPACGYNLKAWKQCSPTRLIIKGFGNALPPMLIIHGALDTTVPFTSSMELVHNLHLYHDERGKYELDILSGVGHAETVLQLMFGGTVQCRAIDWIIQNRHSFR